MGKWCLHASSLIFYRIIIKVDGNQGRHKSSEEFDFGPLVFMAHLYVFWNEIWPWHIGLRWAIVALWATCFSSFFFLQFSNILNFLHAFLRNCEAYKVEIWYTWWQWVDVLSIYWNQAAASYLSLYFIFLFLHFSIIKNFRHTHLRNCEVYTVETC